LVSAIDQQHRKTISYKDTERNARAIGNHAIADERAGTGRTDNVDDIGMHLAKRDEGPQFVVGCGAASRKKTFSIALNAFTQIVFGEAQVERAAAVRGGLTTRPDAERVDEPGNSGERRSQKNRRFGGFCL